jgi:hypothetical protein
MSAGIGGGFRTVLRLVRAVFLALFFAPEGDEPGVAGGARTCAPAPSASKLISAIDPTTADTPVDPLS